MSEPAASDVTEGARSFRPRSAVAAGLAWILVSAGWLWLAGADGGTGHLVRQLPWVLLVGSLVWAVLVRPSVSVGPHGVRLRNPWRDVDVPWQALASVDTRFALTLHTTDGRSFAAWAAPASGRWNDPRMSRSEVGALSMDDDEEPTASASWSSSSGAVAAWIRRERRRARPAPGDAPVRVRVSWPVVGVLAVMACASALSLLA